MSERVRVQPLLAVRDVERASAWYQAVLGLTSGHGGVEYERLYADDVLVLQLHQRDVAHHHGTIGDSKGAVGNGVAVWFAVSDFDERVTKVRAVGATITLDVHDNPNAGHREIWLEDLDGYLVVLAGPDEFTPGAARSN